MINSSALDGDLVELTERLTCSEVSPSEVVEVALARIRADDRAFVAVEADRAIAAAKRLSALRPKERGPLAGAPYVRKDVFGRAGSVLGAGSSLRTRARPVKCERTEGFDASGPRSVASDWRVFPTSSW